MGIVVMISTGSGSKGPLTRAPGASDEDVGSIIVHPPHE